MQKRKRIARIAHRTASCSIPSWAVGVRSAPRRTSIGDRPFRRGRASRTIRGHHPLPGSGDEAGMKGSDREPSCPRCVAHPAARRDGPHPSNGGHCAFSPSRSITSTISTMRPNWAATCSREAVTDRPPSCAATRAGNTSRRRSSGSPSVMLHVRVVEYGLKTYGFRRQRFSGLNFRLLLTLSPDTMKTRSPW